MTDNKGEIAMSLMGEVPQMATPVLSTDFGPNNKGSIGPAQLNPELRARIDSDIARPSYRVKVDASTWHCVDGRFIGVDTDTGLYPAQIAGSLAATETAAELMVNKTPAKTAEIIGVKTKEATADGITVVCHGDRDHAEDGCAAERLMRSILQSNAENIDHVAPRTIALGKLVGLDAYGIDEDDVVGLLVQGGKAAEDKTLWPKSTAELVEATTSAGGEYEIFDGPHEEVKAVVDPDPEYTFDGTSFAKDHRQEDGSGEQVFVVSLGAYVKQAFERGRKDGKDDAAIALECYAAIAFQIGVPKEIGSENLEVAILGIE